jgi:hypothetical protein
MGNSLEALQRQANETRARWNKNVAAVNTARTGAGLEKMDDWRATTLATVLETFARRTEAYDAVTQIGGARSANEATQPQDVSFIRKHGINILTAAVPNFIAHDLVSVQPLQARIGEIRYLDVKYGNNKGPIKAGDSFSSYQRIGGAAGQFDYTMSTIAGEAAVIDATNKIITLDWKPVVAGSVHIDVDTVLYHDDAEGKLLNAANAQVGTVNYATGAVTWSSAFSPAPTAIDCAYEQDNMTVPVEAPEVYLTITSIPVRAMSRKLKTIMAFDAMYDFQIQYGYDSETETAGLIANFLQYEIDGELIEDMFKGATATSTTFNKVVPNAVSTLDHYEGYVVKFNEASNNIFKETRFGVATWAVLGLNASTIVESLANRGFVASGQTGNGPHFIGTMGNFQIFKTPVLSDDNGYVLGYKGDSMFHAGMVYAPYMPIMTTDLLAYENFNVAQGYATAYAKKMINGKLYSKGVITAVGS